MGMLSPHAIRFDTAHSESIQALVQYHDSGAYQRDLAAVGKHALDSVTLPPCRGSSPMPCSTSAAVFERDYAEGACKLAGGGLGSERPTVTGEHFPLRVTFDRREDEIALHSED